MNIAVKRETFTAKSTTGKLYVDGEFFCYTLEDPVRSGPKVYGETAIPPGTYDVIINYSQRFKRDLPLILNVPGFTGIRIHIGNYPKDTHGCLLVGDTLGEDAIYSSGEAFRRLFAKIQACLKAGQRVQLEVG